MPNVFNVRKVVKQLYRRASLRGHRIMQNCQKTGHPDSACCPFNYARLYNLDASEVM